MLLTDMEKIAEIMGPMDHDKLTQVLDLMFYARQDGYYRAYKEVADQKAYVEKMGKQWA